MCFLQTGGGGAHPDLFMARPEDKIEFPIAVIRGDPSSPNSEPGLLKRLAMKPSTAAKSPSSTTRTT